MKDWTIAVLFTCLLLGMIMGCDPIENETPKDIGNQHEKELYTLAETYANTVVKHALSVSSQLQMINIDLASPSMDLSLKAAAVETNVSVLRVCLEEAWSIVPPEHLQSLHEEYLASLEKINEGLAYLERWVQKGDPEVLARGQEIIAEGMQSGNEFAKQLNTEILIERAQK